jgi:hypothetical protein
LAFANTLSSDDIYYTVRGSISVMDGSGRAVPNQEVSIKSYATQYAQGKVCLLDSTVTFQGRETTDNNGVITTPDPLVKEDKELIQFESDWINSEDDPNYNFTFDKDPNYNYTLDNNQDINGNGILDTINPVAIIGGTVSDDGYTFITNEEGRADFSIRYPMRYSNWVKVRFDATTFLNGSENKQSIHYRLPFAESDKSINGSNVESPWIGATSPFGDGGVECVSSMNIEVDEIRSYTAVNLLSSSKKSQNYTISIGRESLPDNGRNHPFYSVDFNQAFGLGSIVNVSNDGIKFHKTISVD